MRAITTETLLVSHGTLTGRGLDPDGNRQM
jgi:hypothetical protein